MRYLHPIENDGGEIRSAKRTRKTNAKFKYRNYHAYNFFDESWNFWKKNATNFVNGSKNGTRQRL